METTNKTTAMLLKIDAKKSTLSKSERLVCDYILDHPDEIIYLSVSELAERSGVSDATVIRASQKLGSKSYQDLKISLAQDIVTPLQAVNEEITPEDLPHTVVEKVFQGILLTLESTYKILDISMLEKAANAIMNAGRIGICGLGNSNSIAVDLQHKLMRLGLDATAFTDSHMQIIAANFLGEGDLLFCVSHSGSSKDIVHAATVAKENQALVISLTKLGNSPLAEISDIPLHTISNETRYRQTALSSRLAQMAIIDVLYTLIALKKEDSIEGFFKIDRSLIHTKF